VLTKNKLRKIKSMQHLLLALQYEKHLVTIFHFFNSHFGFTPCALGARGHRSVFPPLHVPDLRSKFASLGTWKTWRYSHAQSASQDCTTFFALVGAYKSLLTSGIV